MGYKVGDKVKTEKGKGLVTKKLECDLYAVTILEPSFGNCPVKGFFHEYEMQLDDNKK